MHGHFVGPYNLSIMSTSEDEQDCSDDEDLMNLLFLRHVADAILAENTNRQRKRKWHHKRFNWAKHLRKLRHEQAFSRTYRMSLPAFCKLLDLLRDDFDVMTATQHGGYHEADAVEPELIMAIAIRWLAGGSYVDIRHEYGCSVASVFRFRDMFMDAVLNCKALDIIFPDTDEDLKATESRFNKKSSDRIMVGCVGAIDGLFVKVCRPSRKDCGNNPQAYFSGHYMAHGLNIQAICDIDRCFTFFGVVAPGKSSDQVAFEKTSIHKRIMALPMGMYLVGDAAYQVSDVMMVPFTGSHRDDPGKDAFNFFLSQLRIRIAMAFGLLQTKWGVLNKPLRGNLSTAAKILQTCARLHNFHLREDNTAGMDLSDDAILNEIRPRRGSRLGWGYLPTVEPIERIPGTSLIRDVIIDRIGQLGLRRPTRNLLANRPELYEIGLM